MAEDPSVYFGTTSYFTVGLNSTYCLTAGYEIQSSGMPVHILIFCFAFVAAITNIICVYIFAKIERNQNSDKSMNTSLLCLSIAEMVFGLSSAFFSLSANIIGLNLNYSPDQFREFGYPTYLIVMPVVFSLTRGLIDFCLWTRNWITCLITMARAEVIYWPLTNKKHQTLLRKSKSFLKILIICVLISLVFSIIRQLDIYAYLCYYEEFKSFGYSEYYYITSISPMFYFICFSGLPWALICIFSIVILIKLKKSQQISGHDDVSGTAQNKMLEARRSNQAKATRMIVTVAIVFTLTEFPSIIISILNFCGVYIPSGMYIMNNLLVQLDSMFNLIIFITTLPVFRNFFKCSQDKDRNSSGAKTTIQKM